MIRLRAKYDEGKQLRKRGFTYAEIAKILGVAKSTVSQWFKDESWSKETYTHNRLRAARENRKRILLLNKARGNQYRKLYGEAERSAQTEFRHYKKDGLFVAGLMIYVTLGVTTHARTIRLSSPRSDLHRIFIRFAREFLGVARGDIRYWLLLYPSVSERTALRFWVKMLKIDPTQFHKSQTVKAERTEKTLQYGVLNTIIGSTVLKRKLMKWVELAAKEF